MAVKLYRAATVNNWRSVLVDSITDSSTFIGLSSNASLNPSQLQAPGVLVIDRENASGVLSPEKREYISFASVSGPTLSGVVRGLGGSSAQGHTINSLIEDVPSTTMWNDMIDWMRVEHEEDGTHSVFSHVRSVMVTGVSGASGLRGDVVFCAGANISIYPGGLTSGYPSVIISAPTATPGGLPLFTVDSTLAAGTDVTPRMIIENAATIRSVSAVIKSPASGASLVLDLNKNGTTMFTTQAYRPTIIGGGTYVSTASIAIASVAPGDILTLDIDIAAGDTLTVLLET